MHEQFELDQRSHVSDRWGPLVVAVPEALDRLRRWFKSQERVVVSSVREIISGKGVKQIEMAASLGASRVMTSPPSGILGAAAGEHDRPSHSR